MTYREAMRAASREYLLDALRSAGWRVAAAAKLAGINRTWFYKRMLAAGIEPPRPQYHNRGTAEYRALQ